MTGTWPPGCGSMAARLATLNGTSMSSFQGLAGVLQRHAAVCGDKHRFPTATCCCRLVVMSATLGGGVGPRVAQLLAQALPQRYEAVGEAGLSPAQEDAGGRTAVQAERGITPAKAARDVAAPFLVSQGRSFQVRTEYLGLPGAAAGDWRWVHNCKGSRILDVPWGCPLRLQEWS